MNKKHLKTLGCVGCLGACGAAAAAVTFQENFMNYADRVPGVVVADGISVDNDPIWSVSGGINFRLKESANIYVKPIALPKGKFDFNFKFRLFNSKFPVEAKKDKNGKETAPAVAADWDFFDLVFAAGGQEHKVRVAADQIAGKALEAKLGNWAWQELGIRANGKKLAFHLAADRVFKPFAEIELPFVPETLNFAASADKHFGLTDMLLSDGDGLPQHPATKHFASFKSLEQPIANAKTAAEGEKLALAPAPKAGVRMILGSAQATLTLTWADGKKTSYPIKVGDYKPTIPAKVAGVERGKAHELKDATISLAHNLTQFVRPKMNPFMSSYSVEPQLIDVVRDWNTLPAASKHAIDVDLVKAGDNVQIWLDGSYATTVSGPKASVKKGETPPLAPAFASAEIVFGAGVQYAPRTYATSDDARFTVLDFTAYPRAKAFADGALAGVKPGDAEFGGYPMQVAAPLDSADVSICHQAMGNWALEVEEYHGRSPLDGYPSAVHYRLPAAPYARAGVLFALDPDPKKDAILTLRLGKYVHNGSGGNMSGAYTWDFSQGVPDWCQKVGEVKVGGKTVPLWFGDFPLNLGPVVDLATSSDYLDFDVTGKQWENFQQMDNTMKPDPRSDSAFNLFGVTLQKAQYSFEVVEATAGNVFTADEKERGMKLKLKALVDGAQGEVAWTGRDVEGAEVVGVKGSVKVSFAKAGEVREVAVDFGAKTPVGFYTCDVDSIDAKGVKLFTHAARFAILPEAGRQVDKISSPYATWWFNSHGSPGDEMKGFPIMTKAGIRKCSWRKPSKEEAEKWDVVSTGNLAALGERDFEMNPDGVTGHFKKGRVQVPDPADATGKKKIWKEIDGEQRFVDSVKDQMAKQVWSNHMLIWHESGPRGGVPEELLGLTPPEPSARDKQQAAYVNEIGRIMRKHFPEIKLQIGNNSAAMGAAAKPLRYGAKAEYFDYLGMETPAQVVKPERRTEIGVLGMLASQDVASRLAGRKIALNGAWEFIYRAERDMGEELQAQWHARDVLICLAHNFFLISPGILFDCNNGYYNGLWGGSGILQRGPYVYPKRAYVAYAVITKVLDGVKFVRELDTGSSTIYAMEYKRLDGRTVTALWCARGEAEFELDQDIWFLFGEKSTLTEMYGKTTTLDTGKVKVVAGGRPVYVVSANPLKGVKVTGRTFTEDAALAAKATTAAALDKVEDFELKPDLGIESKNHNYFPVLKKSDFTLKGVKDEEKGDCIEVALDLEKNKDMSAYWTEFTTVRFKNPAPLAGKPELVGVWVKGNSNWGQIRFEITDANGEVFKNLSTGPSWACDIMDWPGNLAVDFDGWNFVYTTLKETKLIPTHSPGPYNDQWVSEGGDKIIQYPVKVSAITVGMNRYPTSIFKFADKPGNPAIRLKDVGGIEGK